MKILLFVFSLTFISQIAASGTTAFANQERQVIDISGHPSKGPANVPVTVIVFSDYLCPACQSLEPVLHQVVERYPNGVKLVHKLCTNHDFSKQAVAAAYAAWDQGKFWEFHDQLFKNQLALSMAKVTAIAKKLHFDMERFNKRMKDPAIEKQIDRDMADVSRLSITGTPTVYINGKVLQNRSFQDFQTAINLELNKIRDNMWLSKHH